MILASQIEAAQELLSTEAREILWSRGELSWKLRPEQVILKIELEKPLIQLAVFNICRRFGKTYTLVIYVIEQCLLYCQKIRYGCAFLSDLEEFVLPAFNFILEDCPQEFKPEYVRTRKTWMFKNGSEIKLVGLDKNPNGLRGNAIEKIVVDEAGFVSNLKKIYTSVIIPATAKQKNIKIIFSSTPPETPDHFFVALIDKAQAQYNGLYKEMTIDEISDLDLSERQRLLDEIGGEDSIEAQREFFCKLIIDSTIALAQEFSPALHVKDLVEPEYCHYWVSGDTGGTQDRTVFHLWCYDFRRAKCMVLDEVEYPCETGTDVYIPAVKAMERDRKLTRHVDCPGQLQIDFMGYHQFPCSLPRKDGLDATIHQVRIALKRLEVEISPKCTLLIKTLKMGTLNKQRSDLARTEALGHMDAFMSMAYGLRHANKSNPYPAYNGASPYTHYINPSTDTQTANSLKGLFRGPK